MGSSSASLTLNFSLFLPSRIKKDQMIDRLIYGLDHHMGNENVKTHNNIKGKKSDMNSFERELDSKLQFGLTE